jgi:large repetitive protein
MIARAILFLTACSAGAAVITSPITIPEQDQTFEGADLIVDGTTLTINGAHSFSSILLTNGAVLTHSPCTLTTTYKLDLVVTNHVSVSADSRIDAFGKGYIAGRTTGNSLTGASTGLSGASHGGWGGSSRSIVYGDYKNPNDWGSSGPDASPGGGLIRITSGILILDGLISANGSGWHSGGAGGSVFLRTEILTGRGKIQANGGSNISGHNGNGGGAGRIALYARELSGFETNSIEAIGGFGQAADGGSGTVYLKDLDEPIATLLISGNDGSRGGWTPLGLPGDSNLTFSERVIIRGQTAHVLPEHAEMRLGFLEQLRVENSAFLKLDKPISNLPSLILNGGHLEILESFPVTMLLTITNRGILRVSGDLSLAEPVTLGTGALIQVGGSVTSSIPLILAGSTLLTDRLIAPELTLTSSVITSHASTTNQMHKLHIEVEGTIIVDANSRIDVSGKGYLPGYTTGNLTNNAATGGAGGSHGGWGGGTTGIAYGNYAMPSDCGAGSGTDTCQNFCGGSPGGGLIRLVANSLSLDGQILADGANGNKGGAGGSIWINVSNVSGQGTIRAKGGHVDVPSYRQLGGGGGRIALYAKDFSQFNTNSVNAGGGYSDNGSGGAGTVYLRDLDFPHGALIIDNGAGGATPLGLPGTNHFEISDAVIIRGFPTYVRPDHEGLVLEFHETLTIENAGQLFVDSNSLELHAALLVRNQGKLHVSGSWTVTTPLALSTNGFIEIGDVLTSTRRLNDPGR